MADTTTTADFEFDFEDLSFEDIEDSRRKKSVTKDGNVAVRQWCEKFAATGRQAGGLYTWLTLPTAITDEFTPKVSDKGRVSGGMAAIVRQIKVLSNKDTANPVDCYPLPMVDPQIHSINEDHGEDIDATDPRYGGFILVSYSQWKARNEKKAAAAKAADEAATEDN
jgi:hypothetical protein